LATQIPTLSTIPLFGKRGTQVRDVFVTAQEAAQDHMSGQFGTEMSAIRIATNAASEEIEETGSAVAGDRAVTVLQAIYSKESADKSKQSEDAAEISLQSTIQVISEADITGTAGYTIDVVDDLLSRARNSQFVGLT